MFDKILVVCIGNVCRSPTAEKMLQVKLPKKEVSSAGLGALVNHPANKDAYNTANNHGLSLDNHVAKQLTSELCHQYDLILVMEKAHISAVGKISPESRGKTMLLGHWLDEKEIPDPYKKSLEMYELTYQLIEKSVNSWLDKLD